VPRRYFLLNRELFRMDSGKRIKQYNFCPTNHETISLLQKQAAVIFRRAAAAAHTGAAVYHLWPDRGAERTWCACPACRAFSPEEQNRIAVNAAAAVLAELDPQGMISWYEAAEDTGETTGEQAAENAGEESKLPLRKNMFRLRELPGVVSV
jgi:hypothetical protein